MEIIKEDEESLTRESSTRRIFNELAVKARRKRNNWKLSSFKFAVAMADNKRNLCDKEDNQFIY